jgi:hypothetical protein
MANVASFQGRLHSIRFVESDIKTGAMIESQSAKL